VNHGLTRLQQRIVVVGAAGIAVFAVAHAIDSVTWDGRFLKVDQESNLPTWARCLLYAGAAMLCVLAASRGGRKRIVWLGLGALMLAFSIDDIAMGHEWLEEQGDAHSLVKVWEPLAGVAVVVVFAFWTRRLAAGERMLALGAGLSVVLGQAASAASGEFGGHTATVVLSMSEQSFEAFSGVLIAAAAVEAALEALTAWATARPAV
jgi:hypothetical protein